ncbi:hypothetical protein TGVAND_363560 [Toxoplasma gondii VAND]|uniref:Uncharacterized protein n=1 Tax=Toxoplasma gondii VAND TaxID=933077 RepID=A0A086PQJ4_TOXGO|nr:hypothetical protein TGVAND_363560 [Toxoplasma gondii VAND]
MCSRGLALESREATEGKLKYHDVVEDVPIHREAQTSSADVFSVVSFSDVLFFWLRFFTPGRPASLSPLSPRVTPWVDLNLRVEWRRCVSFTLSGFHIMAIRTAVLKLSGVRFPAQRLKIFVRQL